MYTVLLSRGNFGEEVGSLPAENPPAPGQDLIWLRPERSRREPRPVLSRAEITRAAIELADREGLQGVSMRRVAGQLGAHATSLYWYVDSKDDLFELMLDAIMGEIELPGQSDGDWRAALRSVTRSSHAVLSRHHWAVLLAIQPGLGPNTQRYAEYILGVLHGLGLDVTLVADLAALLNNYLFGFAHRETAWEQARLRSGLSEQQWAARLRRYLDQVTAADPAQGRLAASRMDLHTERSFEFGRERLLDGIEVFLSRQRPG